MGFASFVLMVEPTTFYVNRVTAQDNACQPTLSPDAVDDASESLEAIAEHRRVAHRLQHEYFVDVVVVPLTSGASSPTELETLSHKPDAIFPNNSISFHVPPKGSSSPAKVILYPMSPGRKDEIPPSILSNIAAGGDSIEVNDLRHLASDDATAVMEGTGAMNISTNGTALFVSISLRASRSLVHVVRPLLGIDDQDVFVFTATDFDGKPMYHTNVVGWVGSGICAWCFESMRFDGATEDEERLQRDAMMAHLRDKICNGRADRVLSLTREQMLKSFSGNCLELHRVVGGEVVPLLCMSTTAWKGYTTTQQHILLEHYKGEANIAVFDIPTIERLGGGSVRCLLAASSPLPSSRKEDGGEHLRHYNVFQPLMPTTYV